MPKIALPLNNTQIKQAKSKAKEYNLVDGGGLTLRIKPNGSKLWLFNYSHPYTKKRNNLGFGVYPDVSLAEARELREKARKLLAQNIDPKEKRDEEERLKRTAYADTLKHVSEQWLAIKRSKISPDYALVIWNALELHIFPELGNRPLHKITAPIAIETLRPIAIRGSLETAKRMCQRLNEIMVFAVNTGLLEVNPLAGIGKAFQSPQQRNMPTLKPEQLPELMKSLTTARIKLTTRCLIEWQLHTMVRPGEAAGTSWAEIDVQKKLWHIPAERMKKKLSHSIPLTSQTLGLLEVMRPISGHRKFVFPSDIHPNRHINESTANMALKRMGYAGKLVAHGLRSIASTTLNEQGFDADVIEAALAHIDTNEVRRAYNRADYLERRKVMMAWWSEHIEQAATGNMSLAVNRQALRAVKQ